MRKATRVFRLVADPHRKDAAVKINMDPARYLRLPNNWKANREGQDDDVGKNIAGGDPVDLIDRGSEVPCMSEWRH